MSSLTNCFVSFLHKTVDFMLPCIFSVIDHSRHQNVALTTALDTLGSFPTFLFLPNFEISSNLLLNRHMATWNLFVYLKMST